MHYLWIMAALIGLSLYLSLAAYAFSEPTQDQLIACVETTNYTLERCKWEMTR